MFLGWGACVGCSSNINPQVDPALSVVAQDGRFQVKSAQKFYSGGRERHIMVLFDTKTEKEYLVVMGAGVYDLYESGTKGTRRDVDE